MSRQPGFLDLDDRYALLRKSGDPLARPASAVNVEMSRFRLEKALKRSPLFERTSTDRKEADRRAAHQGRYVRTQMNEALLHVFRGQPRQIVRFPGRDRGVPEGREGYLLPRVIFCKAPGNCLRTFIGEHRPFDAPAGAQYA